MSVGNMRTLAAAKGMLSQLFHAVLKILTTSHNVTNVSTLAVLLLLSAFHNLHFSDNSLWTLHPAIVTLKISNPNVEKLMFQN